MQKERNFDKNNIWSALYIFKLEKETKKNNSNSLKFNDK